MPKGKRRQKTQESNRVLYWISHIVCAFVVVFLFLTLAQCTIKKPEAPSWDTNFVIPLVHKTWDMPELIDKINQDQLTVDSAGNPIFYFRRVLDTVNVSGSFAVDDASLTLAESLGVVELDPFNGTGVSIVLADYIPPYAGDVPPISFDISEPLPPTGEFAMLTIESGYALITIQNDFGLNLDTVIVTINDTRLGGQLTSYSVPGGILAGDYRVDTLDLAGKTVSNELELNLHCYTPGATSFSLSGKAMSAAISMPEGPTVSSATAQIPEITRTFSESVEIACDHRLQLATLDAGRLILDIQNLTSVQAGLTVTLPDVKSGGSPLVILQPINPNWSQQFVYDLTGYDLEPADQTLPQSLVVDIQAVIDSSGQQLITFNAGDRISVTAAVRDLSLASVTGIVAPTTADFAGIQQEIAVPKGFDQVQLTAATLALEITNSVDIPGTFAVTIDGDQGQQLVVNGAINPGTPSVPVLTTITESDLASFLNPVPSGITVNGAATFGDGVTSGSINKNDFVTAAVTIYSPLEFVIGTTTFDGEWESTEIDQSDITKLTDNVNLAQLYATVTNHLPLGMQVTFLLGGDSTTLYSNPELTLGPIMVDRGALRPDGTVDTAVVSHQVLTLDSQQVRVLENSQLWIGEIITLESSNGTTVRLTAADGFSVSGYIDVDFTVSSGLWED